tara:strand:+ start:192 stop:1253 length:1062 start_codon:yes stop_codon:yes gene_type:complete
MGKQVKTPRFYVDMPTFLHATGQLGWDTTKGGAELLYMNPSNPFIRDSIDEDSIFVIGGSGDDNPAKTSFPVNFIALLNHNLASDDSTPQIVGYDGINLDYTNFSHNNHFKSQILNADRSANTLNPLFNGTTIFEVGSNNEYWTMFKVEYASDYTDTINHQLGSFVVGKYWDAPNSPDLSLTMSRRFDGIKKQKTIGGKTLANIYYDGPTEWTMNHPNDGTYKYPPFELDTTGDDFNQKVKSGLGRKGLRSWNLTFSYISESDMWMENEVSNTLTSDNVTPNNEIPNPMLSDDSFNFVWNCTLGGTLPFIFQPDNTNNNPDQFSICTFRENSFNVNQVAFNTYSVSMTIDEIA